KIKLRARNMKTLNELIEAYTNHLQQGEIQIAYKGILDFLGKLRAEFIKKHPHYDVSSIYQGYMDMSYFSLSTKSLKDKGLKIAIVYLHDKGDFEVWLSARNREISKQYESVFCGKSFDGITVFHDDNNQDAIIEYTLTSSPNFEDQVILTDIIEQGIEAFITAVSNLLIR
ncbi:MAG: hypothetical protein PHN55_14495, partial [Dysgonamonadaceae bacterium]|nr:hypothetical protein [Dysgonamonadaceae bacterium]